MARAILSGPDAVPDATFVEGGDRLLMGFAAHANTINHARLVALEETFPRCRSAMGDAAFNQISRAYVDSGIAGSRPLASIGHDFADWLAGQSGHGVMAMLARAEWAWLESYHAADASALTLTEISAMDEATLLGLGVRSHPAARLFPIDAEAAAPLGVTGQSGWLFITRPDADVLVHDAPAVAPLFWPELFQGTTMAKLIQHLVAQAPDSDPVATMIATVAAGAVILKGPTP